MEGVFVKDEMQVIRKTREGQCLELQHFGFEQYACR